jgi:hypothetical protein
MLNQVLLNPDCHAFVPQARNDVIASMNYEAIWPVNIDFT